MRESYGTGLLGFHQFRDLQGIGEHARIPADRILLAAFVARPSAPVLGNASETG
jgi:hypothetical protein